MEASNPTTAPAIAHYSETDALAPILDRHSRLRDLAFEATNRRSRPGRGSLPEQLVQLLQLLPWPGASRHMYPQQDAEFIGKLREQLAEATQNGEVGLVAHREGILFRNYVEGRLGDQLATLWLAIGSFLRYDQFLPGSVSEVEHYAQEARKVNRVYTNWVPAKFRARNPEDAETEARILLELADKIAELRPSLERAHKGFQAWETVHQQVAQVLVLVETLASALEVSLPDQVELHLIALRPAPAR